MTVVTVHKFFNQSGIGFGTSPDHDADILIHHNNCTDDGFLSLHPGDRVRGDVVEVAGKGLQVHQFTVVR